MTRSDLRSMLGGAGVDDILVTGFIDVAEQPVRFHALYRTMYFDCGGVLLKFSAIRDTGRMHISAAQAVSCDADLDDDMQPACTSIRQAVLLDPDGANRLVSVHLWEARDEAAGIDCAAARFDLANGQRLFLDPSYYFGIRLGSADQQLIWSENYPQGTQAHAEIGLSLHEG